MNRKLNKTPITKSEVQVGNLFRHGIYNYVVTELQPLFCSLEYFGYDWKEKPFIHQYDVQLSLYEHLQPIELWDASNQLAAYVMGLFDFEVLPQGIYRKEINGLVIEVQDKFYLNECALFVCTRNGKNILTAPVWYLHEIQNYFQEVTGSRLLDEMSKKILFTKKMIE